MNMNSTIFIIFGITGDLASRKLLPSLLNLYVTKWGRQDFTKKDIEESFRFYYKLYKNDKGTYMILPQEKFKKGELKQALSALWNRIFNY